LTGERKAESDKRVASLVTGVDRTKVVVRLNESGAVKPDTRSSCVRLIGKRGVDRGERVIRL
jgi:hypothetical protein